MKTLIKQIILLLLCIALLPLSAIRTRAEEDNSGNETIHSEFYALTTVKNTSIDVPFNINWFRQDARIYSHDLAKLSIGLATAAFRPNTAISGEGTAADMNLSEFLEEAHFTDLRSDDYDKNPSKYTVSTVMGHQKVGTGDDAFELIAVGVCGQGYVDEWESNFTIGNGKIHEGFKRSSDLIYDRIFGYIAGMRLEGPMKIWISGFSRAAAVSNITAARLTDSMVFSQETVFAYTFATPRTAVDPNYSVYRNIFNIVGKADPVPNIPFADWGYERYGTTLYLPALETDSDFMQKRVEADRIYKQLTGIDYWYNEDANKTIRTILSYFLEIFPTAGIYSRCLQDKLIYIWENPTPTNVLRNLLDIANDPVVITDETRDLANSLLNYMTLLVYDYASSKSIFRKWNRAASAGANLLQAHTPELYVSWMFSADTADELYTKTRDYTTLYVDASAPVYLQKNGVTIESIDPIFRYDEETGTHIELVPESERTVPEENIYLTYNSDGVVATVPGDTDYTLYMESSEGDARFRVIAVEYTTGVQTAKKNTVYHILLHQGDHISFHFSPGQMISCELSDTFDPEEFVTADLGTNAYSTVMSSRSDAMQIYWRDTVIYIISGILIAAALLFFLLSYSIGKTRFRRRMKMGWIPEGTKYRMFPIFCIHLIFMLLIMMQVFHVLIPDDLQLQFRYKLAIGIISVLVAGLGFLQRRSFLSGFILIALVILTTADIITTDHLMIGSIMHITAYLVLSFAFMKEDPPELKQFAIWIILSVAGILWLSLISGEYGLLRLFAMIYLCTALLMITMSFGMPRRVFIGTLNLFLAGISLMYNQINGMTFVSHLISLTFYYSAIAILASTNTRIIQARAIPDFNTEKDEEAEAAA